MKLGIVMVACVLTGCTTIGFDQPIFPAGPDASTADAIALGPGLRSINENIFRPRCLSGCHSGTDPAGHMDLRTDPYVALVNVPAGGISCGGLGFTRVIPGDPDNSLLFLKLHAKVAAVDPPCGDPMPQGVTNPPITQAQLDAIHDWILAGAINQDAGL